MEDTTLEIERMEKQMEMEKITKKMAEFIKDNLIMENGMEKEYFYIQMEHKQLDSGKKMNTLNKYSQSALINLLLVAHKLL